MNEKDILERECSRNGLCVVNEGRVPEIWLYGIVGESADGITAKQFRKELDSIGSAKDITVRINSPGGTVGDGLGIYNSLKRHSGRVTVEIDGIALSAASFVAMAGDEIRMASNSLMMIHDAWDVAVGNATDLRKKAQQLDIWNTSVVGIYAERTGLPRERIAALMAAETWMEPEEAKTMKFADTVVGAQRVAAKFDPGKFKNVPPKAFALAGIERPFRQRVAIETEAMRQALESLDSRRKA